VDPDARRRLIDIYATVLAVFEAAVGMVSNRDLFQRRTPDKWSAAEVIHHVADTEVIAGGRLRVLLARDGVPIVGYDQELLGGAAEPANRPVEESLRLIRIIHAANLSLLKSLHLNPGNTMAFTRTVVGTGSTLGSSAASTTYASTLSSSAQARNSDRLAEEVTILSRRSVVYRG
jgi:hypothetical protein